MLPKLPMRPISELIQNKNSILNIGLVVYSRADASMITAQYCEARARFMKLGKSNNTRLVFKCSTSSCSFKVIWMIEPHEEGLEYRLSTLEKHQDVERPTKRCRRTEYKANKLGKRVTNFTTQHHLRACVHLLSSNPFIKSSTIKNQLQLYTKEKVPKGRASEVKKLYRFLNDGSIHKQTPYLPVYLESLRNSGVFYCYFFSHCSSKLLHRLGLW